LLVADFVEDPDMRPTRSACPFCNGGDVGRPINLVSGNVWFDQTDVSLPGRGPGLTLTRSYNSLSARANIVSPFGRGWAHSLESSLAFPEAKVITLRQGSGVPMYFQDFD